MIYGIGTDLVKIKRLDKSLEQFDDKFAEKILHDNELLQFKNHKNKSAFLAKRFAAKEAFFKALGTGIRNGLCLNHIEVFHDELGKPNIQCHAKTQTMLEKNNIHSIHLSLTDEDDYASAVVVLEKH